MPKPPTLEERIEECCGDLAAMDEVTTKTRRRVAALERWQRRIQDWRTKKVDADIEALKRHVAALMRGDRPT